jgi:hypothetical protein
VVIPRRFVHPSDRSSVGSGRDASQQLCESDIVRVSNCASRILCESGLLVITALEAIHTHHCFIVGASYDSQSEVAGSIVFVIW